jgi:small multidrug resistance pump
MPKAYLFLVVAIAAETVGTSALQARPQFSKLWPTVFFVVAYAVSFYLLGHTLKYIPVGIAYAIWSGLGIVLITLIGYFVFSQSLDLAAILGLALIIAGVLVNHLFSTSASH